ncbi:protein of unknown function [Maridesulfovibrio ferrireducens]|uniref:DUF4917 domain-containing protein n=1 Tax=Maridesulfovibrio ferrireducens TaxID=246191 RepID=A0A1G9FLB2_9BACT|nr:DUF4917 family protein [Maridesulfovibrio ferrireducens]SDK89142.1 protein of unknown function [Maridesulfovibrio ferrireducens]
MPLMTFEQAIASCEERKNVLLGNGFSMAYSADMFSYSSLYEKADIDQRYEEIAAIFNELDCRDFETVMNSLNSAAFVGAIYDCNELVVGKMNESIQNLKDLLISSIANTHPTACHYINENKYKNTRKFLLNFSSYFTTNYDLLLYWSLQNHEDGIRLDRTDGFLRPNETLSWEKGNNQNSYYLHGAMHLYKDKASPDIEKLAYTEIGNPLTEQVRSKIDNGAFPIFISEGRSLAKLRKIEENKYLLHCLEKFREIQGTLFIHGHSFSTNDDHIWDSISNNNRIERLFVSIYGDENSQDNIAIKNKVIEIGTSINVSPEFYSSESANLWTVDPPEAESSNARE